MIGIVRMNVHSLGFYPVNWKKKSKNVNIYTFHSPARKCITYEKTSACFFDHSFPNKNIEVRNSIHTVDLDF